MPVHGPVVAGAAAKGALRSHPKHPPDGTTLGTTRPETRTSLDAVDRQNGPSGSGDFVDLTSTEAIDEAEVIPSFFSWSSAASVLSEGTLPERSMDPGMLHATMVDTGIALNTLRPSDSWSKARLLGDEGEYGNDSSGTDRAVPPARPGDSGEPIIR